MNRFFWLASYPKSGNTWLRLFLESMASGGGGIDINTLAACGSHAALRCEFDYILDIESGDLTDEEIACARPRQYEIEAGQASAPMLRKVHDAWGMTPAGEPLFPPEVTLGAVYLVRDPRDVAVSMAHHMNKPVDHAIARMGDPQAMMHTSKQHLPLQLPQGLSSWSGHVASWLDAPINRCLIRYEDMLAEPVASFGEIARFLLLDAAPGSIASAVDAVRFDRLRDAESRDGFVERQPGVDRFFRRGIAGGWRDSLSPEQISRIESDHGPMMRLLGYL
jgi:hypothetical protein